MDILTIPEKDLPAFLLLMSLMALGVLSAIFGVVLLAVSGYMLYRERMRRGQITRDGSGEC